MNDRYERNEALLQAAERCDLQAVERLLALGADPMGPVDARWPGDHILCDLFCTASTDDAVAKKMPTIMQLFFDHGLDLSVRDPAAAVDSSLDPLWSAAFWSDGYALETLKMLEAVPIAAARISPIGPSPVFAPKF